MKRFILGIALLGLSATCAGADSGSDQKLCAASESGTAKDVGALLAQGASANASCPNAKGDVISSPLTLAVKSDSAAATAMLLAAGARVDAVDSKYGLSALFGTRSRQVGELLLNHGANLKQHSPRGSTPFSYLVARISSTFPESQAEQVATLFLEHGADINDSSDGQTALMSAAVLSQPGYMKFLIDHKADVNARDKQGDTVLAVVVRLQSLVVPDLAAEYNSAEALLRAHGAKE